MHSVLRRYITFLYCDILPIEMNIKVNYNFKYIFSFSNQLSKNVAQWVRALPTDV